MPGPPKGQPLRPAIDRFTEKVVVSDGCWIWAGNTINTGYGSFYLDGRMVLAHRAAFEFWVAPIPAGLVVDHLCGEKLCVRPDHLEAVTQRTNVRRAVADKQFCVNGHPLTGDNLGIRSPGWRFCRTCKRACDARRRARLLEVAS